MVRVLHIFGQLERGGAELRTIELAESLDRARVTSHFLVLSGRSGSLDARVEDIGGRVLKCGLGPAFPLRFIRTLKRERIDVVHSHVHYFSGPILALALMAGVRVRIAHFRTSADDHAASGPLRNLQRHICRSLLRHAATHILAVSEGVMGEAWSRDWRQDSRCQVIYNGLPADRINDASRELPASPAVVINVAGIHPRKNQKRLLTIFQQCLAERPDMRLQLVGRITDGYAREVTETIRRLGLENHVEVVGEIGEPLTLVARASVMVLPSMWEGLPGAALEACALGVPVVASDLPGTRELAQYFPHVQTLSLSADDAEWARRILGVISGTVDARTRAAEVLSRSPFDIAKSRQHYYDIWCSRHDSA